MKIAAFDLGSTWAVAFNEPAHVIHRVELGKRPAKLAGFLETLGLVGWVKRHGLDVVVYERPFARGLAATRMLWGMAGVLEAAAETAGVAVLDITPSEIKKWATGHGMARKPAMIARAKELGYDGDNEHEADAYCLLKFAEATLTKEP